MLLSDTTVPGLFGPTKYTCACAGMVMVTNKSAKTGAVEMSLVDGEYAPFIVSLLLAVITQRLSTLPS